MNVKTTELERDTSFGYKLFVCFFVAQVFSKNREIKG